jgi:hypothetical protein
MPAHRTFDLARYTATDGCYRPDELAEFGVADGAVASDVYAALRSRNWTLRCSGILESMLTTAECDVVAGLLIGEIAPWIPDSRHPRGELETSASDAFVSWHHTEHSTIHERLGRLHFDVVNIRMDRIESEAGLTRDVPHVPTPIGYDEWRRIDELYIRAVMSIIAPEVSVDIP